MLLLLSDCHFRQVSYIWILTSVKLWKCNIAQDCLSHVHLGKFFSDAKSWTKKFSLHFIFPFFSAMLKKKHPAWCCVTKQLELKGWLLVGLLTGLSREHTDWVLEPTEPVVSDFMPWQRDCQLQYVSVFRRWGAGELPWPTALVPFRGSQRERGAWARAESS